MKDQLHLLHAQQPRSLGESEPSWETQQMPAGDSVKHRKRSKPLNVQPGTGG